MLGKYFRGNTLLNGLVAYWKLEESSGTRVDATGRGNDLAPQATPGNTTGRVGNAVQLTSASSQFLNSASTADLTMGDFDFTFAFWVWGDTVTPQKYAMSKWTSSGVEEYSVLIDTGNRFKFYIANFAKVVSADNFGAPSISTWYFVVCQHDAANDLIKISVNDGTMNTAATAGAFPAVGVEGFAIGSAKSSAFNVGWNGRIDEFGIWKRLLTAAEITSMYNGGSGITYPFIGT